jgi:FkbM family methyltransferase
MPKSDLIFDVGAHNGDDTAAYLARGFRVIAVEANPILCEDMHKRFASDIKLGRAVVVNKAIDRRGGGKITLHVNSLDSAQGTAIDSYSQRALARGGDIINYDVPTVSLSSLIEEYGKAHYIKIDIEGMDGEAIASLSQFQAPQYISIERPSSPQNQVKAILTLRRLGYTRFQTVDQSTVGSQVHPALAIALGPSGLFGDELPQAWVTDISAIAGNAWVAFRAGVMRRIPGLSPFAIRGRWFDIHAARAAPLKQLGSERQCQGKSV